MLPASFRLHPIITPKGKVKRFLQFKSKPLCGFDLRKIALRYPRVLIRRNGGYLRKRKYPQIPAKRPSQNGSAASILKRRSSEMSEL
jgi:hypothetical protein